MAHLERGAIRAGAPAPRGLGRVALSAVARTAALGGLAVASQLPAPPELRAQRPMGIRVELGADVDANSGAAAAIFRVWRSYLARWPARREREPNPHWLRWEQERLFSFDLVGSVTYGRPEFRAQHWGIVLGIIPADTGASPPTRYVVRTLFATDGSRRDNVIVHVYAVREGGRWLLSNALHQRTRGWLSTVVGPISYVYPPTHAFDTARAAGAVRFVDSLAAELKAGRVQPLVYVMARSPAELRALFGLEQSPLGFSGRAIVRDRLLLSGEPEQGEAHLHELAHFVIAEVLDPRSHNSLVVEGAASWVAGRADGSLRLRFNALRRELDRRPTLSLRDVVAGADGRRDRAFYPLGTVLCQMAFERGGVTALRRLLRAGRSYDDLLQTLSRVLGLSPSDVDTAWRDYVLAYRSE